MKKEKQFSSFFPPSWAQECAKIGLESLNFELFKMIN